jgi:hypothetical protein
MELPALQAHHALQRGGAPHAARSADGADAGRADALRLLLAFVERAAAASIVSGVQHTYLRALAVSWLAEGESWGCARGVAVGVPFAPFGTLGRRGCVRPRAAPARVPRVVCVRYAPSNRACGLLADFAHLASPPPVPHNNSSNATALCCAAMQGTRPRLLHQRQPAMGRPHLRSSSAAAAAKRTPPLQQRQPHPRPCSPCCGLTHWTSRQLLA